MTEFCSPAYQKPGGSSFMVKLTLIFRSAWCKIGNCCEGSGDNDAVNVAVQAREAINKKGQQTLLAFKD
jgi:hypothetical protein